MSTHWLSRKKTAVFLRAELCEITGTTVEVWKYRHKTYRVGASKGKLPASVYSPYCGRQAFYKAGDKKDPRNQPWFSEFVRDRRQRHSYVRAVNPGIQRMR